MVSCECRPIITVTSDDSEEWGAWNNGRTIWEVFRRRWNTTKVVKAHLRRRRKQQGSNYSLWTVQVFQTTIYTTALQIAPLCPLNSKTLLIPVVPCRRTSNLAPNWTLCLTPAMLKKITIYCKVVGACFNNKMKPTGPRCGYWGYEINISITGGTGRAAAVMECIHGSGGCTGAPFYDVNWQIARSSVWERILHSETLTANYE